MSEADEIVVSYLVLCDQVITEAQTGKQSLIGIYSTLLAEQFPLAVNVAVALCIRVQSARSRELSVKFAGPDNEVIFGTPTLPLDWASVQTSLKSAGFAMLQMGVNLRALPITTAGVHTASLYCDGSLIATCPVAVLTAPQRPPNRPAARFPRPA